MGAADRAQSGRRPRYYAARPPWMRLPNRSSAHGPTYVSEQIGRGSIYMGAVSSVLITLGFLAQVVTRLDPFVAALLPALFVLGELTFAALVRNTIENLVLLEQMQRIRGYYRGLVPEASQFFDRPRPTRSSRPR